MAELTVARRFHNIIGNRRVDMGQVGFSGATSGEIVTTLHHIESVQTTNMSSADLNTMVFPNANSPEAENAADQGTFHIADVVDGSTILFIAIGW